MPPLSSRFVWAPSRALAAHVPVVLALFLSLVLAHAAGALTLTGFAPPGAPPNTWITLTGSEFLTVNSVRFNGTNASFSIVNDTQLNAYVPGSATTGPISVGNGTSTATSAGNFFVGYPPSISNLTPTGGGPGTSVTINGSSFSGITSVKFNGTSATFLVNSTTQIVATVPAGASTGNVTVTNPSGTSTYGTFYFPPTITSFAPAGGQQGTPVTVYGNNFNIVGGVSFNGTGASFSVQDNTRLLAYVPNGATTGPITVSSFAGPFSSATPFFVGPSPTVTNASPAGGPPGTGVTIDGTGFVSVSTVTFGGVSAPFSVQSPTQILATVPGAATTGPLSVNNPTGTGTWSSSYYVGNAPAVSGLAPTSGPVGTAVTLSGSGFTGATSVSFGGANATSFVVNRDDELVATVPVGATTSVITVTNPAGSGSSAVDFAVSPQVLAASPMSAPASTAEGTQVEIYGHNFTGSWQVTFGGTLANFTIVNDDHLTAWIPPGATSGPIAVTTLWGVGISAFSFEIVKFVAPPHSPYASWPMDVAQNLPVASGGADQYAPDVCADSTGGVYIAWQEYDAGEYRIRLQRLTGYGEVAPGWPATGLVVGLGAGSRQNPRVCADLVGGAIVVWEDARNPTGWDIYATRIGSAASIAVGWSAGGNPICTASYEQRYPVLCSDGMSGAYITWQDLRSGGNWDIYVQHMLAGGAIASGWDTQGLPVSLYGYHDYLPSICVDGTGGAYVCWRDDRNFPLLQRVLANGLVAPGWPANGMQAGGGDFGYPPASIVPDGSGNVTIVWSGSFPYAMKWMSDGTRAPNWPTWGRSLNNQQTYVVRSTAASDSHGGVFAAWEANSGSTLVAQHLTSAGAVAPGWPTYGYSFRSEQNQATLPSMTSDGTGGAVVTWQDYRLGAYDIYAQRFTPTNSSQPAWQYNGVLVSGASGHQTQPVLALAGTPGVVIAWSDARSGSSNDIYAQNITLSGKPGNLEPHILSVRDVANDQGGKVRIVWQRSQLDTLPTIEIGTYGVWRQVSGAYALAQLKSGAAARLAVAEDEPAPGLFRRSVANAQETWWEGLTSIPARGQVTYSFVAATLADSGAGGAANEIYMVDAHASFGSYFWSSEADSGHSTDNLPPVVPAAFAATFLPGSTQLHWHRNPENDIAEYRVYRGTDSFFAPSEANLVGTTTDTAFADPHAGYATYKLIAVDVHANASAAAIALPPSELDAPNGMPLAFDLGSATPNPAAGRCALALRLPQAARVNASVYDAAGRRVRSLSAREWTAGAHSLGWNLRDDAGRTVADGLYFVRVEVAGQRWTRRVVVLN
jgi:hypothetical protein